MQQAIYNNSSISNISSSSNSGRTASADTTETAAHGAGIVRWIARRWDLVGVLTLMGSSAAYGVFALAHVGL